MLARRVGRTRLRHFVQVFGVSAALQKYPWLHGVAAAAVVAATVVVVVAAVVVVASTGTAGSAAWHKNSDTGVGNDVGDGVGE